MTQLYLKVKNLLNREEGQGMVEYAMIIGLVAIGVLTLLGLMGGQVADIFRQITQTLTDAKPVP